jgi:hypothetical protein
MRGRPQTTKTAPEGRLLRLFAGPLDQVSEKRLVVVGDQQFALFCDVSRPHRGLQMASNGGCNQTVQSHDHAIKGETTENTAAFYVRRSALDEQDADDSDNRSHARGSLHRARTQV